MPGGRAQRTLCARGQHLGREGCRARAADEVECFGRKVRRAEEPRHELNLESIEIWINVQWLEPDLFFYAGCVQA